MAELNAGMLLPLYMQQLLEQVMPFWEGRIDRECGGILNCVSDSGVLQSTDKYLWSQGRALWTFSALVNRVAPEERWRAAAENIAQFLFAHGRQPDGSWAYVLTREGAVKIPPQSIYVDGFVLIGMTEYARMSGSEPARALALDIYERIAPRLADHGTLPTEPHAIPKGFQAHGPLMIFAHAFHELGVLAGRADVLRNALALADRIMHDHVKPDKQALLEFVRPGGGESDCEIGRTVVPGHAIESMWFLEKIYAHHGRREQIPHLAEVVRWHLEKGWDEVHGGLRLALGLAGGKPHWQASDVKAWWPHVEALYALLRFHAITGEAWCAEWYGRVHDYTFSQFPNRAHGEWFNYLDAAGNPLPPALKNLPVKDPFHLPRALILGIQELA
jgi:N-acylglucosamine 2-epimerase